MSTAKKYSEAGSLGFSTTQAVPRPKPLSFKRAYQLKWSQETVNSSPQSMQLSADEAGHVWLTQPGIYQIHFVLFVSLGQIKPSIELRVDEQIVQRSQEDSSVVDFADCVHFRAFVKAEKMKSQLQLLLSSAPETNRQDSTMAQTQQKKGFHRSNSQRGALGASQSSWSFGSGSHYNTQSGVFSSNLQLRKQTLNDRINT